MKIGSSTGNRLGVKFKKPGYALRGMVTPSSGPIDHGFYGHLDPEALKESPQVETSVTNLTRGED